MLVYISDDSSDLTPSLQKLLACLQTDESICSNNDNDGVDWNCSVFDLHFRYLGNMRMEKIALKEIWVTTSWLLPESAFLYLIIAVTISRLPSTIRNHKYDLKAINNVLHLTIAISNLKWIIWISSGLSKQHWASSVRFRWYEGVESRNLEYRCLNIHTIYSKISMSNQTLILKAAMSSCFWSSHK